MVLIMYYQAYTEDRFVSVVVVSLSCITLIRVFYNSSSHGRMVLQQISNYPAFAVLSVSSVCCHARSNLTIETFAQELMAHRCLSPFP